MLEALSRGLPVIATRRGTLADLLPADRLVDEPDPAVLAARVAALRAATGWRSAAAQRARASFAALRGGEDPLELVLGPSRLSVLQVLPTFDPAFGGPVSAAWGVTHACPDVELTTAGAGVPDESWVVFATQGFRIWSSSLGPPHVLSFCPGLLLFVVRGSDAPTACTCTCTSTGR